MHLITQLNYYLQSTLFFLLTCFIFYLSTFFCQMQSCTNGKFITNVTKSHSIITVITRYYKLPSISCSVNVQDHKHQYLSPSHKLGQFGWTACTEGAVGLPLGWLRHTDCVSISCDFRFITAEGRRTAGFVFVTSTFRADSIFVFI